MALADLRQLFPQRATGVLWPADGQDVYAVGRLEEIPEPLRLVVRHLWSVTWRRPEEEGFTSTVLTNPVAHLTFEDATGGRMHGHRLPAPLAHGLVSRVFRVELPVAGRVSGVAFHPGVLVALFGGDARELVDRVVPARELFGDAVEDLARAVLSEADETIRQGLVLDFLRERLAPELDRVASDPAYQVVRAAEDLMRAGEQTTLGPIADAVGVSPRTLQRMFARSVGVSPLWVLRRYRLQGAATALDTGDGEDLAGLAASLGFADQAHLTRTFTAVIGVPPSRYRAGERPQLGGGAASAVRQRERRGRGCDERRGPAGEQARPSPGECPRDAPG